MKIAICDDDKIFVKRIYDFLWQRQDYSVDCFLSPSALLAKYESGESYDILFLDIRMQSLNGISLAKKIRAYSPHVIIVFLSAYVEYAPSGYEVNAFRYLLKPVSKESLFQVLKDIHAELEGAQKIILKTSQCELVVHTNDIYYLEANDKETTVCYNEDIVLIRKGLHEIADQLPASLFFRVHRKYLVNLAHVREYDEKHLTLSCGHTLPISRRNSRSFRDAIEAYIERGLH